MYEQTYKRLEKLKNTFDNLVKVNQEQSQTIKELSNYVNTAKAREDARERVLASLEAQIKRQEIGESLPPPS